MTKLFLFGSDLISRFAIYFPSFFLLSTAHLKTISFFKNIFCVCIITNLFRRIDRFHGSNWCRKNHLSERIILGFMLSKCTHFVGQLWNSQRSLGQKNAAPIFRTRSGQRSQRSIQIWFNSRWVWKASHVFLGFLRNSGCDESAGRKKIQIVLLNNNLNI